MTKKDKTEQADTGLIRVDDALSIGADRSIVIDMNKLGVPQDVYDADVAWVTERMGAVSFFFGKCDMNQEEALRTRLELRYPVEAFVGHFWKNSREFHEGLRDFAKKLWKPEPDKRPREQWSSLRDHSEWVNFDYVARSGTQAVLDFFYLSPTAIARWLKTNSSRELSLAPKVRVQTTTVELARLLDACDPIARKLADIVDQMTEKGP